MVALNFMQQFVPDIQSGKKRQTIRGKTWARSGSVLQLYTGMRTKFCRKIMDVICASVQPLTLMAKIAQPQGNVVLMGMYLEEFAKKDGFKSYADMWDFFEGRANDDGEYNGVIIKW